MTWLGAWAQRTAVALWAWLCQRVAQFTDWCLDYALAHMGKPMEWRDVERLARERAEWEERRFVKIWNEMQEAAESNRQMVAEAMRRELLAIYNVSPGIPPAPASPRLRLLKKP